MLTSGGYLNEDNKKSSSNNNNDVLHAQAQPQAGARKRAHLGPVGRRVREVLQVASWQKGSPSNVLVRPRVDAECRPSVRSHIKFHLQ